MAEVKTTPASEVHGGLGLPAEGNMWYCGQCEMPNTPTGRLCPICTAARSEAPTATFKHPLVYGGDIAARAREDEGGVTSNGRLFGPDGEPLTHQAGLADRVLRLRRAQSLH